MLCCFCEVWKVRTYSRCDVPQPSSIYQVLGTCKMSCFLTAEHLLVDQLVLNAPHKLFFKVESFHSGIQTGILWSVLMKVIYNFHIIVMWLKVNNLFLVLFQNKWKSFRLQDKSLASGHCYTFSLVLRHYLWYFHIPPLGFDVKWKVWTERWAGGVTGKPKYYFTETQSVGTSMTANKLALILAAHHPLSDGC